MVPLAFALAVICSLTVAGRAAEAKVEKLPAENGEIEIEPVNHATFILRWNGKSIFVDPVGGAQKFSTRPDIVLITDIHGDHLNVDTLKGIVGDKTKIVAPAAVVEQLPADLKSKTSSGGENFVLANGEKKTIDGITIEAVPMYNLTQDRLRFHAKGRGNGYVVTLGGKRIYISGDTEDIPEMRALQNIDVAFICMNLPYTMTVDQAASAVKEFKPKIAYPYHHRGSDIQKFKELVGANSGVEVRLLDWYAR